MKKRKIIKENSENFKNLLKKSELKEDSLKKIKGGIVHEYIVRVT